MKIVPKNAPHFNDRPDGVRPSYIILHYTGTPTAQDADDIFMAAETDRPVSTHYMVDEDGTITRYVDERKRAWHAGQSYWRGETDMNGHSIGIEIANPGHEYGYRVFPAAQMQAVAALCCDIMARFAIPSENILGHADIAPARKDDPGELFHWRTLAARGIGVWPDPVADDLNNAAALLRDPAALKDALYAYGYDPSVDLPILLTAFQRHFEPEIFAEPESVPGQAGARTAARLLALRRFVPKA